MAHSSGGGSHAGGAHYSSHGSNSENMVPPISRHPYIGAHHYVYYAAGGEPVDYYYKGTPKKPDLKGMIIGLIIVTAIAIPLLIFCFCNCRFYPEKTEVSSYDSSIVISDSTGLLDNEEELRQAIEDFRDETGVTLSVEIISKSEVRWYEDLEDYAYNEYERLFRDEKHWLFVVAYPENTAKDGNVNWDWEGMIGDDLGDTIGESSEDRMTDLVQNALEETKPGEVGEALVSAFSAFEKEAMETRMETPLVFLTIVIGLAYLCLIVGMVSQHFEESHLYEAYLSEKENACGTEIPASEEAQTEGQNGTAGKSR